MKTITGSIVLYKSDPEKLVQTIRSFLSSKVFVKLFVIDNSPTPSLKAICESFELEYIYTDKNLGFGRAHNIAIERSMNISDYHVVINPDVYFNSRVLVALAQYMELHREVGMVMPKILNPDGSLQYNCKLLPSPHHLIIRRFLKFNQRILERNNYYYEMRFSDYNETMNVPFLSGCFMFLRNTALKKAGLFDERFFLYAEDTDLTRRIGKLYKTIYYPRVSIHHYHERGSHKSVKLLLYNIHSVFRYFNKWGWFYDRNKDLINSRVIKLHQVKDPDYFQLKPVTFHE